MAQTKKTTSKKPVEPDTVETNTEALEIPAPDPPKEKVAAPKTEAPAPAPPEVDEGPLFNVRQFLALKAVHARRQGGFLLVMKHEHGAAARASMAEWNRRWDKYLATPVK